MLRQSEDEFIGSVAADNRDCVNRRSTMNYGSVVTPLDLQYLRIILQFGYESSEANQFFHTHSTDIEFQRRATILRELIDCQRRLRDRIRQH